MKNSAPLENQWAYDVPVVPSCPSTATQTTPCDFAILQWAASLQLDTPLDKCQCAPLAMKRWKDAFYPLQCHSGQLDSYWDKPEISPSLSCSHSLELLQNNSGHRFSSLDPLEIVLMGWKFSEEDLKTQPTAISLANQWFFSQQSTSVWMPDGLCPFWYFSLISLITVNPLISHTALIPAHHLIILHQNTI